MSGVFRGFSEVFLLMRLLRMWFSLVGLRGIWIDLRLGLAIREMKLGFMGLWLFNI